LFAPAGDGEVYLARMIDEKSEICNSGLEYSKNLSNEIWTFNLSFYKTDNLFLKELSFDSLENIDSTKLNSCYLITEKEFEILDRSEWIVLGSNLPEWTSEFKRIFRGRKFKKLYLIKSKETTSLS